MLVTEGFLCPKKATLLGRKLSGDPLWGGVCLKGDKGETWTCGYDYGGGRSLDRTDPILIQVVEQLGDKADGDCAKLVIEDLEKGALYRITEYHGYESIELSYDVDWSVA